MSSSKLSAPNTMCSRGTTYRRDKHIRSNLPFAFVVWVSISLLSSSPTSLGFTSSSNRSLSALRLTGGQTCSHSKFISYRSNIGSFPLRYRSSDDDQNRDRRKEHDDAAANLSTINKKFQRNKLKSSARRNPLLHHDRTDSSAVSSSSPDIQQFVLDEYLESIDRRYKRLHRDEEKEALATQRGFTNAWSWLMHTEPSSEEEEQRKQEDALYVFGLADLASAKLLQKHHLPVPKSKIQSEERNVIDIVALPAAEKHNTLTKTKSIRPIAATAIFLACVASVRKICVHSPLKQLKDPPSIQKVMVFSRRAIFRAFAKTLSSLVSVAGTKRVHELTITVTATLVACMFAIFHSIRQITFKA